MRCSSKRVSSEGYKTTELNKFTVDQMTEEARSQVFGLDNLRLAYERCVRDFYQPDELGRSGFFLFEADLQGNLARLSEELCSGDFYPRTPLKYFEPKASGTLRPKTLLNAEDAIVYQCIIDELARQSYAVLQGLDEFVFGQVVKEEVAWKAQEVLVSDRPLKFYFFERYQVGWSNFELKQKTIKKRSDVQYCLKTDIASFFSSVNHEVLRSTIEKRCDLPDDIVSLLFECLYKWSGVRDSQCLGVGIPQGPGASSFLANLLLASLDEDLIASDVLYMRYVDDIHVFLKDEKDAWDALVQIDIILQRLGLTLNSSKTRVQCLAEIDDSSQVDVLAVSGVALRLEEGFGEHSTEKASDVLPPRTAGLRETADELDKEPQSPSDRLSEWQHFSKEVLTDYNELVFVHGKVRGPHLDKAQERLWMRRAHYFRRYRDVLRISGQATLSQCIVGADWLRLWTDMIQAMPHRANHFIWALEGCASVLGFTDAISRAIAVNERHEKIVFELLVLLSTVPVLGESEIAKHIEGLVKCDSELARLGYYLLLLKRVEDGSSELLDVLDVLRTEKSPLLIARSLYCRSRNSKARLDRFVADLTRGLT